ncbi:MAG: hypothetical protein HFI54_01215 [Lachnospiraceae bacterium]|jgi:DNA-binding MarR family transcriptional regulator|nr:hypothetical protein [Lachnospiraceae bacterium]RKI86276.1 hypothetical protein D7V90_00035 [bacterium 1xD42-87]
MYKEKYVINFFKADQDEMQRKTRGFSKIMVELIAEAAFGELEKLQQECKQMRYSAQGYLEDSKVSPEEKNTLVNIGYINALLDVEQMYLQKLTIQNEMQQIKTRYKNAILAALVKAGTMLHKDLACAIGVSASGLTAVIKQMNATSVPTIRVEEVSKYKLYSITPAAYQYITHYMPGMLPEMETGNREQEVYFDYVMAVRSIKQNRKMGIAEKEREIRSDYVMALNRGGKKFMNGQAKFGSVIEFSQKLA